MKRQFSPDEPELMDLPQPVGPELQKDLANLEGLNRYFGGHAIFRHFLRRWFQPGHTYRVLDLATGAGDGPRTMAQWAAARSVTIEIDAVDLHPSTLEVARSQSTAFPNIQWHQGDALTYQPGATYDLVSCTLALHHFSEADAVALLRQCARLSHRYVLVADLERSWSTTIGVWLATALIYRDPMTQYDARLSTRRAFSFAEFRRLAAQASWLQAGHRRFYPCRQAVWLEQR